MIRPEKYSKSIGNRKMKFNISVTEMFICACIPIVMDFVNGMNPLESTGISILLAAIFSFKNGYLERNYFKNVLTKKDVMPLDRVVIND